MKKCTIGLSVFIASIACSLFAAQAPANAPAQAGQNMNCSQLSQAEQNFAAQIMDMNNKMMFCSQMTMQQRQQAMQMMGQPDSSGNVMNADQAVQQVMGSSPMMAPQTQPKSNASSGGCPVQ